MPSLSSPTFTTTSAAVARVRADLVAQGFAGPVNLGKQFLKQHRDPTPPNAVIGYGTVIGSVVIVPLGRPSKLNPPRLLGGNPAALFTIARPLEIHCWSRVAIGGAPTQYEADLAAAEILTASVLRSFEKYIPGTKRGGDTDVTYEGEIVFGVETTTRIEIDLEVPDTTYALATGAVFIPGVMLQFPDGTSEA